MSTNNLNPLKLTFLAALFAAPLVGCEVDVDDPGELRAPKVDMKGGDIDVDLPKAEVTRKGEIRAPDIDVETPDVKVGTKPTTIQTPTIDVDMPKDDDDR